MSDHDGRKRSMLSVHGLSLTVGGAQLLDSVNIEVPAGCYCSIIGPNGAGKSTLLKCLNRLVGGWSGEIRADGRDVREMTQMELARFFGYVPQFRDAPPDYTVSEFLRMSRYACGHDGEDAVIEQALETVGMSGFSGRYLPTLSGGECQKVFLAAGVVQQAPVLLLDEPGTFLDPRYQQEMQMLLQQLNRGQGITIVCVTHELNSALASSDIILGMKNGHLVFQETPEQVLEEKRLEELFQLEFERAALPSGRSAVVPKP